MARVRIMAALALLAACVPVGPPGAALSFIEVSSGGAFSGSDLIRVYPDDRIEGLLTSPWMSNHARSLLRAFAEGMFLPLAFEAERVGAQTGSMAA